MAIILRWTILVISFCFAALIYGISKEIFPPSFLTGAIRGALVFGFLFFVWDKTKKIGKKRKKESIITQENNHNFNTNKISAGESGFSRSNNDISHRKTIKKKKSTPSKNEGTKMKGKINITINENVLYEQIWREIDENKTDVGLWAKCFAKCEGDENKTKALYVNERILVLKENLKKQLVDQEREEKKEAEKENKRISDSRKKSNQMLIFEGRMDNIEIFTKTLKTMPTFFPNILGQFGYNLVQNKDREKQWSIHLPNGTGIKHVYNIFDLKIEITKIVVNNKKVVDVNSGTKMCPSCGLVNSVAATQCDCGNNFI